jgi:hypothetical protein
MLPPNRFSRFRRDDPSFVVKITANKHIRLQLEKWTKCHVWLFGRGRRAAFAEIREKFSLLE